MTGRSSSDAKVGDSSAFGPEDESQPTVGGLTAELDIPNGGAEGVIIAHGGHTGGWSLCVHKGQLKFAYNWFGRELFEVSAPRALPPGHRHASLGVHLRRWKDARRGRERRHVHQRRAGGIRPY